MERLHRARDAALGSKKSRVEADLLPVETKAEGDPNPISCATREKTRCYSLGVSYEKPPTLCAPNANLKIPFDGAPTVYDSIRKEIMEVRSFVSTLDDGVVSYQYLCRLR